MVQDQSVGTLPDLVRIDLYGPLCLTGKGGANITPRGAKTGALVAVLALSPGYRRSRRWLEGLLWSRTGRDQASASLRQALSALRRELGDDADCLCSDRRGVWLDAERTVVGEPPLNGHAMLLDGMDIRDPVFADWLTAARESPFAPTSSAPTDMLRAAVDGVVLRYLDRNPLPPELELLRDRIVMGLGKAITERMRGWVQSENYAKDAPEPDVEIECSLAVHDGAGVGFIKLIHTVTGQILLSETVRFGNPVEAALDPSKRAFVAAPCRRKASRAWPMCWGVIAPMCVAPPWPSRRWSRCSPFAVKGLWQPRRP